MKVGVGFYLLYYNQQRHKAKPRTHQQPADN